MRAKRDSKCSRGICWLLFLVTFLLTAVLSWASDGDVDPTFKTDVTENNGEIKTVVIQSDGKFLVGGSFEAFGGRARRGIARLNSDGTLDLTFDPGGAIPIPLSAIVRAIAVQPDGKILVGVSYSSPGPTPQKLLFRFNTDGTLDSSFNPNLFTRPFEQDGAFAIALQSDGKILVGGDFRYNNQTQRDLARLNADGSFDSSFNQPTGGLGAFEVRAIAIQSDGKIVVGGKSFVNQTTGRGAIFRLNSDGTLDTNYGDTNIQSGNVSSFVLQPDGSVVAVGSMTFSPPVPAQTFNVVRFSSSGVRDSSFPDNIRNVGAAFRIVRQSDGKFIVVGNFQFTSPTTRSNIARLNSDGTLDASFSASGSTGNNRTINAAALQSDGKIIVVGAFDNFNGTSAEDYVRLNSDGTLDTSLVQNSVGYHGVVYAFARQPDGKILIGIGGTKVNGVRINGIVRLNKDYSVDTTFNPPLGLSSLVLSIALQSDGKILISGYLYINQNTFSLLRLNSDGSLDTSFNPPANLKNPVVQPDGRILAVQSVGTNRVVRLNSDGSLDNTFTANFGSGLFDARLALQPDGKVIAAGFFSTVNNVSRNNIARLNADGSVDTSFDPGTGADDVIRALLLRSDGRILIGGSFLNYNGVTRNRLALIEPNGSLNNSFVPSNPANITVYALAQQADGKILYGGEQLPSGSRGVYRLNSDGTLDSSFALGATTNRTTIYAIFLQTNGKIIAGGSFDTYNGIPRMSLVRLNPRNQVADFDYDNRTDLSVFRPSDRIWYIRRSSDNQFYGVQWGLSSDKPVAADYDGDGKTDIAVWREGSLAYFYILNSSNNTFRSEQFGQTGDDPSVVGDWDGDGRADPAVYRNAAQGNQSYFYYRGSLNNPNGNITSLPWGASGDRAVRGDFDGDEIADAAIFRPSNRTWYIRRSSDGMMQTINWGLDTDKLVPADYDGDGKTDAAVFRNGTWFVLRSLSGATQIFYWGLSSDALVPADYDGDGRADPAVYRSGVWYIAQSTGGIRYENFGLASDIPISLIP